MTGFKGWEICARRQSRGLFISPSLLFSFLAFISFSVLYLTFFSIDKFLQNGRLWHLKTLPTDHAAYWIWHHTWQPLWGLCEVARLCHDWPTALTNSVYLRSCDYKVTRWSWFHSQLQAEQCNTKNDSYICSCTSSTKLIQNRKFLPQKAPHALVNIS